MSTHDLRGATALITGASGGIGLAMADAFARAGANLLLLSRTKGGIDGLAERAGTAERPGTVTFAPCDVTDRAQVEAAVARLAADGHGVDVLVNNAGIALGAPHAFWEQSLDDLHTVLGVNTFGLVNVTHAVLRAFLIPRNRGTVLNISSVTGLEVPVRGMGEVSYHASKAFMEGFTNALRNEVLGTDIRVLTLRPGFVRTNFHFDRVGRDPTSFEEVFAGTEPLVAEDIAAAALWMLAQPERMSVKAMDLVPTAQRSLTQVDRDWSARHYAAASKGNK